MDNTQGKTDFHLLAVDIPSTNGGNARIFLSGKPSQLTAGGIYDEMCVPLKTVCALATR